MITSILTILASLAGLWVWWYERRAMKRDDPTERRIKRHEEIAREIIDDDPDAANARLDDWIKRLRKPKVSGDKR